jgi:predicted O-methyltransferase YrrM
MIMNKQIEKYIFDHSTPEDPVLEDLYRQTHIKFVNPNRSTGFIQGKFLELISGMIKPSNILEIGTFSGYSAICLAKGLAEEGKLTTIDINDELRDFAHDYFCKAGLENKIIQLTGRAQEIIPQLDQVFDLIFIDGDKREYCEYYNICLRKTRPGSFIIADNVLWGDKVLEKNTKDPQSKGIIEFNEMIRNQKNIEKFILPIKDGLMIIKI